MMTVQSAPLIAAAAAPVGTARALVSTFGLDRTGDVVLPGSLWNRWAAVSRRGHEVARFHAPPVGYAELEETPEGVWATITYFPDEGSACELAREATWSVGFSVLESHEPTARELAAYPGAKRVITSWMIIEVSPVADPAALGTGSGEVCCNGLCTVGGKSCCAQCAERQAVLKELARYERTRFRLLVSDLKQRAARWEAERRANPRASPADTDRALLEAHELRPWQVSREARGAAEAAVERASEVLGGPQPAIRFFHPDAISTVQALGIYFPGDSAVWLAALADPEEIYAVACHETFHAVKNSGDEEAAARFGAALACLRDTELRVGPRRAFEGEVVRDPWRPHERIRRDALAAGSLIVDGAVLYEMQEDFEWRRVGDLIPA